MLNNVTCSLRPSCRDGADEARGPKMSDGVRRAVLNAGGKFEITDADKPRSPQNILSRPNSSEPSEPPSKASSLARTLPNLSYPSLSLRYPTKQRHPDASGCTRR